MTSIFCETTDVGNFKNVVVTAGMVGANGQVFGLWEDEYDASKGEDDMALGTVGRESLTADQIAMAERNSRRLAIESVRDEIVMAIESADPFGPEEVADQCINAYIDGRDWRKVLADAVAFDRAGGNSHME